jgi:SAM-dependent methyltransferase
MSRAREVGREVLQRIVPTRPGKYAEETRFWREEIQRYVAWYEGRVTDHYGHQPPTGGDKVVVGNVKDSAILTWMKVHQGPKYLADLDLPADAFKGMKILDVGAGPLPSATVFDGIRLYALDPLYPSYLAAGYPLHYYDDVHFVHGYAEDVPVVDGFFDGVISVNAIDHVDDLWRTSGELRRVLKDGGLFAMHVHYHAATATEPLELSDERFADAFAWVPGLQRLKASTRKLGSSALEGEVYTVWRNF